MKGRSVREMLLRVQAVMLALVMLLCAVPAAAEEQERDRYHLEISILPEEQAVHITVTLDYVNRTGSALSDMMFSVYANILRRQASVPVEDDHMNDAFPEGYAPGGVDFIRVSVNGEEAEWGVQGTDELFVRVPCSLEPGERAQFSFEYYLLLPVYSGAMGTGDLTWRLTNFYPVAAYYDPVLGDFPLDGYTAMLEPLTSDAADYTASISLPETYHLAAPGEVSSVNEDGTVHYEISAEGIRELALIFSRKTTEAAGVTNGGVTVRALGNTSSSAQAMLQAALPVLNWLEENLGPYPWPMLTLIETEYIYEGLSHPGVIQVSEKLTGLMDREALSEKITGLCMDQYFGEIVGSSQNGAPWLSEAVSAYAALLYYEDQEGYDGYLKRLNRQVLSALQITIPGGVTVDSTAERFTSRMEYDVVVVDRGTAVLHEMRSVMGRDVFMEGLTKYVSDNSLSHATTTEFLAAMNAVSGRRWDEYLYGQMHNIDDYVELNLEWYE